ncbi:Iron-sulfur cluster co-chaperone protein HscB, mitochondrial, partial [Stegodyphus mimosarum]
MERGLYLLELHGKPLTEEELSPEILADVMEVNEMLEECQTPNALEAIRHVNDAKLQLLFSEVSLSFKEKNFNKARESLCKLKYYVNIDKKIRKMEEDFGISRDD